MRTMPARNAAPRTMERKIHPPVSVECRQRGRSRKKITKIVTTAVTRSASQKLRDKLIKMTENNAADVPKKRKTRLRGRKKEKDESHAKMEIMTIETATENCA